MVINRENFFAVRLFRLTVFEYRTILDLVYLNRGTRDEKRDEETVRSRRIKRSILPLAGVFSFAKSEAKRVNEIRIPYPDVASRRPTTTTRFTVSREQDPTP